MTGIRRNARPSGSTGCRRMWRRVFAFAQRGSARAGAGQAAAVELGHPAPLARDSRGHSPPLPALGAAVGGSGVGSAPSSEEAARGYARRAGPGGRDLRVGPSGRHARRRDPDGRVCVGRTAAQRGGGAAYEQLREEPSVRLDPADEGSMLLPCLAIQLARTMTAAADEEGGAFLVGPRSRRRGNGFSARTSRRGRCSGRSTGGAGSRTGR